MTSTWLNGRLLREITPEWQDRADRIFTERYRAALTRGEHLWIATPTYYVTPPLAGTVLDRPADLAALVIGCFACERLYETGAEDTPCPGEQATS